MYRTAYKPFLSVLSKFPDIKVNLHYSGFLLEWLEQFHPELVELLVTMVIRGQVEILGGGYYEPIIPCIPDGDAIGQTALLREKITSMFDSAPRGFWTAERVWEPRSPEVLRSAGVGYTLLDDTIFMGAGIGGRGCLRPHLIESRGSSIAVFPMLKSLRYLIPWKPEVKTISFLKGLAGTDPSEIAVFGDDGEKFGSWPTTQEKVYKERWLEDFLRHTAREARLETVRLSDYLEEFPPKGRAYLPTGSYDEMLEWSLPPSLPDRETRDRARGFWRIYLAKYPEAARLYSRMLDVSAKAQSLEGNKRPRAMIEVWKAQFNDVYWHGVFGGLHSPFLRRIAYHHVVRGQRLTEPEGDEWLKLSEAESDGELELRVDTSKVSVGLAPHAGGTMTELDFKVPAVNVLDVLTRRREKAHETVAGKKARGLGRVFYDKYPRLSFQDLLVGHRTSVEDFEAQRFSEPTTLADQRYTVTSDLDDESAVIGMSVSRGLAHGGSLDLKKEVVVNAGEPGVACEYHADLDGLRGSRLAVVVNIGCLGDRDFMKRHSSPSRQRASRGASFDYPRLGVSLSLQLSEGIDLYQIPVATLSQSEEGMRKNMQGVSIVMLPSRKDFRIGISCS